MLFTSGSFVILVLVTMLLFYLPPLRRWQTAILVLSSFVFYAVNAIDAKQPAYVLLLVVSIAINASASYAIYYARSVGQARGWATLGVIANLAILASFKYSGLIGRSLPAELTQKGAAGHFLLQVALPVGISFFTFEGISLVVDTFRARGQANFFGVQLLNRRHHLASTTLFVSFFPHLVAGPILKAHDFYPQIKPKFFGDLDWDFCFGKLVVGYFLKMVIADSLNHHTFWIQYPYFQRMAGLDLLVLLFGYSMQIFADFAGYSLIAIGVAGLFGYRLPENFNFPYISQSFSEFWRRWHISLSSWLKEYLYFPLGGNRKGNVRTYFNLFVVMFLGGLWHGAAWGYAIWGSVHGLALAIERLLTRGRPVRETPDPWWVQGLKMLMVFSVVTAAWLVFKLTNIAEAIRYVEAMVRNRHKAPDWDRIHSVLVYGIPVVIYHLGYLVVASRGEKQAERVGGFGMGWQNVAAKLQHWVTPWARPIAYGAMLFLIITNAGIGGAFIYFQF
jgi:alginate O-acetyltransferase complex protein AlgI